MANKIKIKRGNKEVTPILSDGEIAINYYDNSLYIGKENLSNIKFLNETDIKKINDNLGVLISEVSNSLNSKFINAKFPPIPLTPCYGDGENDDTTIMNNLITHLSQNEGGFLFLPKGVYICDGVKLKSKVGLLGVGQLDNYMTSFNPTILKGKNDVTNILNCEGVDGATIENIGFIGGNNGKIKTYGVIGGGFINFINCTFSNLYSAIGNGVGLQTFVIDKCKINNCNIGIWSPVDSRITNNTINANVIGLKLGLGGNDNIISQNKIEWNSGYGIEIYNCSSNVITNNIIDRSGNVGIHGSLVYDSVISNNVFKRNGATTTTPREMSQIYLDNCYDVTLNGNISKVQNTEDNNSGKNAPENGFTIYNSTNIIVNGNLLKCNTGKSLDSWQNTNLIDTNNIKNIE